MPIHIGGRTLDWSNWTLTQNWQFCIGWQSIGIGILVGVYPEKKYPAALNEFSQYGARVVEVIKNNRF